ncbi:MAG: glycoside hydrolase family 2 [Chloroflexi bacterium]|nr:glycoside hydrolase family 2 [Chloroflexota bacterium]
MSQNDFFARIALDQHPIGKGELIEPQPPTLETHYFHPSDQVVDEITEPSYENDLQQFKLDLAKLREQYRPFLQDFTPPLAIVRDASELNDFQFRYESPGDHDFSQILAGDGEWETVKIPDYRGPTGRWTGFYRTEFSLADRQQGKRVFLRFLGVDYIANVYLNDRFVGSHEGLFAPFEFDVSDVLQHPGKNVLVIEVKNDYPTLGIEVEGEERVDGDKIYAATGPGWDDPLEGWHHCPPGAGIYNKVLLEIRPALFVHDLFVRPNIDGASIEAWVEVFHTGAHNQGFDLALSLFPRNFQGEAIADIPFQVAAAGPGVNFYRLALPLANYRSWSPAEPWLYTLRAAIRHNGELLDEKGRVFGMRKFHMDEEFEPKGSLYLNNQAILLRGANEMGHLQQCVMREDYDQLIDDILIAKLANMNYYRITQRPVQEEIYDYCDRLGMMHQCDLPLFGYLRRNQFSEAVRQAGEMERLIRSHPSAIMVSFINEPFPIGKYDDQEDEPLYVSHATKGHRHLFRDELEAFFAAARKAIYIENPDRIVKNVEGDYDPPTDSGLSDFHCYNMWYTNHALPIGRLHRGYLPAIKKGWKTGCGEYGTEGLDNYDVMIRHYPKDWLPASDAELWQPDGIIRAQTHSMHGDWFEEQTLIKDWIEQSQQHQALATRLMNDAFRRRSDLIVSTAIHLLIDAWPAGWMKTLVDVDRVPKPAYFACQRSLAPIRVNLRSDRWQAYSGERIDIEVWILNDTVVELRDCRIVATSRTEREELASFEMRADVPATSSHYAGSLPIELPSVADRQKIYVDAILLDAQGMLLNSERLKTQTFSREPAPSSAAIAYVGSRAKNLAGRLNLPSSSYRIGGEYETIVVDETILDFQHLPAILDRVNKGSKAILLLEDAAADHIQIGEHSIHMKSMNGLTFIARNAKEKITQSFRADDFSFWYNAETDCIDVLAESYLECEAITPLLFTYQKPDFFVSTTGVKKKLPVVGYINYGMGKIIVSTLRLAGFLNVNPTLDRFFGKLVSW